MVESNDTSAWSVHRTAISQYDSELKNVYLRTEEGAIPGQPPVLPGQHKQFNDNATVLQDAC